VVIVGLTLGLVAVVLVSEASDGFDDHVYVNAALSVVDTPRVCELPVQMVAGAPTCASGVFCTVKLYVPAVSTPALA